MGQIDEILRVAISQLGTAEEPRGSNRIKYNTAYYGREVSGSGYPWCMVFVWWVFREAGLQALFFNGGKTASCTSLMRWAKTADQWVIGDYRRGDVLLFQFDEDDFADHVGILERVEGGRYVTIEGNTNDEVRRVSRGDDVIMGAWRPPYSDEESPLPVKPGITCRVELPEISFGDAGASVLAMQILLAAYGYTLPVYGADGDFGGETGTALKRFQKNCGLTADGVCGERTWSKLLGVG